MLIDKLLEVGATFCRWDIKNSVVFRICESADDQMKASRDNLLKYGKKHRELLPLPSWLPYGEIVVEYDDCIDWYVQDGERIYYASLLRKSVNEAHKRGLRAIVGDYVIFTFDNCMNMIGDFEYCTHGAATKDITFISAMYSAYAGLARFLDLLSCKNIKAELTDPPEDINRKRSKKGKVPLVSYYTLKIQDDFSGNRSAGPGEPQWSTRVHLCRGHMREYTPDKPLFGKYSGRFWISPHARGCVENGIIHKRYEVKP